MSKSHRQRIDIDEKDKRLARKKDQARNQRKLDKRVKGALHSKNIDALLEIEDEDEWNDY